MGLFDAKPFINRFTLSVPMLWPDSEPICQLFKAFLVIAMAGYLFAGSAQAVTLLTNQQCAEQGGTVENRDAENDPVGICPAGAANTGTISDMRCPCICCVPNGRYAKIPQPLKRKANNPDN